MQAYILHSWINQETHNMRFYVTRGMATIPNLASSSLLIGIENTFPKIYHGMANKVSHDTGCTSIWLAWDSGPYINNIF